VGAIMAAGAGNESPFLAFIGLVAMVGGAINVFGGYVVTHRMLLMFKSKDAKK
jgi:NAD(P) transhydrogenase subunit alpha